jgi:N-acetylneuraminic acid mutarotase
MFQQEQVTLQNPSSWRIGKLTSLLSLLLLLAGVSSRLAAQANEWTWMSGSNSAGQSTVYGTQGVPAAGNVPGARYEAVSWTDASGNLWLFGGWGRDVFGTFGDLNDLWKYTASTGEWTWIGGSDLANQPRVYGTKGVPGNVPGTREGAVSWTDASGNLWLFGGGNLGEYGYMYVLNDLWKYTPSTGEWTWMSGSNSPYQPGVYGTKGVPAGSNVPGARYEAVSWTDASGNLWLFGGEGFDASGFDNRLNDLWKYTPSTGEWTWMSGNSLGSQPGVYGFKGVPAAGNVPGARQNAASWTDASGNLWLFGGLVYVSTNSYILLNDLWKYTPPTGEWTWIGGSNTASQPWWFPPPGVYGTKGVPATGNVPGGRHEAVNWTDASGNLWLFGGVGADANCNSCLLNDLWKYTPSIGEWTWMGGSNVASQPGVYGTKGVPAGSNVPGARFRAVSWTDPSGSLWLFGGDGIDGVGTRDRLNDLWKYNPAPPTSTPFLTTPAPGSKLSGSTATFAWSNPRSLAPRFVLRLGTTGWGASDVFSGTANTGTSEQVSAIPTEGAYLYARLWYYLNGKWQFADARYAEAGTPTFPALTAPAPGSTLPGSTVTFGWDPGEGPTRFVLRVGTTGLGSMDVYSGPSTTATSLQLTTVPTKGAKLYARLWYYLNETWQYVDATYTEASQ